jgi:hypothetical protein
MMENTHNWFLFALSYNKALANLAGNIEGQGEFSSSPTY